MLWRRCNPEFPLKFWAPTAVSTLAIVPYLRIRIYQALNVPYILASHDVTTPHYKRSAMFFFMTAFLMNLILPYVLHVWSKELTQNRRHFAVFCLALIGFALYSQYADYYVRQCPGNASRVCAFVTWAHGDTQEDEQMLQYATVAIVPWAVLILYDRRKGNSKPFRNNCCIFMLASCLLSLPQGARCSPGFPCFARV